jgi:hypothetical protein
MNLVGLATRSGDGTKEKIVTRDRPRQADQVGSEPAGYNKGNKDATSAKHDYLTHVIHDQATR